MPQHPSVYAKLLGEKIQKHQVNCWLVNTGWTGGPYGVGHRMPIKHTRAMLNAVLEGKLDNVEYVKDPIFQVEVPTECPGVPSEVLIPKNTWQDKEAFEKKAKELAGRFKENFEQYKDYVSKEVELSGPQD